LEIGEMAQTEPKAARGTGKKYFWGPRVDASGTLPNGRDFADADVLKKILLEDKDQLSRNLVTKLTVYGSGMTLGEVEQAEVEDIVQRLHAKNHGLRSMIHEVVQSRAFQRK